MDVKNLVTGVLWTGVVLPGVAYPLAGGWGIWACDAVFAFSLMGLVHGVWFRGKYLQWSCLGLAALVIGWEVFQWNVEQPDGLVKGMRLLAGHVLGTVWGLLGAAIAVVLVRLLVRRDPPADITIEVPDEEEV